MTDFEEKVRAAFDAELKRAPGRPGLRQRVIAKAVSTPRTQQSWFSVWLTPPRLAMAGAAAAVLIASGVGIRVATQGAITAQKSPAPSVLAFGKLPSPSIHAAQGIGGGGSTPSLLPYFGPANMTWVGTLPKLPSSAPVYRFNLPTPAEADRFAASLGATLTSDGSGKAPRMYRLPDGRVLGINLFDVATGEPNFDIQPNGPPAGGTQPLEETRARAVADAELARLGLTPSWKFAVSVSTLPPMVAAGPLYVVQYQRLIDVPPGVTAGQVNSLGDPVGLRVEVDSSGKAYSLSGVLRLAEEHASYPMRAPSEATPDAVKAPPSEAQTFPTPSVSLTKMSLVYAVTTSGQVGYLEPAYLFTGRFFAAGTEWEKRVLVPAMPSSALSS